MPIKFIFPNKLLKAWMLLHQTYNSILRRENAVFTKSGLSTTQQHAILMAIQSINGPATPTEIAKWVNRNINSITLIIDRMEKVDLVRRVRDVGDRRSHRIEMTEKGKKVLEKSTKVGWDLIQDVLSVLSDNEVKILIEILGKIKDRASSGRLGQVVQEINIDESKETSELLNEVINSKRKKQQ